MFSSLTVHTLLNAQTNLDLAQKPLKKSPVCYSYSPTFFTSPNFFQEASCFHLSLEWTRLSTVGRNGVNERKSTQQVTQHCPKQLKHALCRGLDWNPGFPDLGFGETWIFASPKPAFEVPSNPVLDGAFCLNSRNFGFYYNVASFFHRKKLYKLLSPEALILAQNASQTVWPGWARTRWGSYSAPPEPPSWIKGMGSPPGRGGGKGEGKVGMGGEGGGKGGTWAQFRL